MDTKGFSAYLYKDLRQTLFQQSSCCGHSQCRSALKPLISWNVNKTTLHLISAKGTEAKMIPRLYPGFSLGTIFQHIRIKQSLVDKGKFFYVKIIDNIE